MEKETLFILLMYKDVLEFANVDFFIRVFGLIMENVPNGGYVSITTIPEHGMFVLCNVHNGIATEVRFGHPFVKNITIDPNEKTRTYCMTTCQVEEEIEKLKNSGAQKFTLSLGWNDKPHELCVNEKNVFYKSNISVKVAQIPRDLVSINVSNGNNFDRFCMTPAELKKILGLVKPHNLKNMHSFLIKIHLKNEIQESIDQMEEGRTAPPNHCFLEMMDVKKGNQSTICIKKFKKHRESDTVIYISLKKLLYSENVMKHVNANHFVFEYDENGLIVYVDSQTCGKTEEKSSLSKYFENGIGSYFKKTNANTTSTLENNCVKVYFTSDKYEI